MANKLDDFLAEIRKIAPSALIICLQLLRRLQCRSKSVTIYNEHVLEVNKLMRTRVQTAGHTWWWSHKALWGSDTNSLYKRDGVHLSPIGLLRYMRSIRGAILCVIKTHF